MRRTLAMLASALLVLAFVAAPAGAQVDGGAQSDPDVYAFGGAPFLGSTGAVELSSPIVDMAGTASGAGYWEVAADGTVFAYGDATDHGHMGGVSLAAPIVDMASTPAGGYWLFAADGGVFSFGGAQFLGSMGGVNLVAPVVDGMATPTGDGYVMVAADGGVFTFGDATFHGSAAALPLRAPVVAIDAPDDGGGYWLTAADGGIFTYGDLGFHGSAGGITLNQPIVDMAAAPDGDGYWLAGRDGGVFSFDVPFLGSLAGNVLNEDVVAIEARVGGGYWMATEGLSRQQPVGNPDTSPKASDDFPSGSGPIGYLTDVRLAGHQGFDRLVLEFEGGIPSWSVEYVDPPIREDGSGQIVAVEGNAFLEIVTSPASAVDLTGGDPEETFGPDRIDPPQVSIVEELVQTGDFEAVMTWVAGLEAEVPFAVTTLDSPPRLVIDMVTSR